MITKERLEELKLKYKFEACKIIADAESEQRFLTEKENKQLTKFEEKMHECDNKLWALKYHATRTEELDLPMFSDDIEVHFIAKNGDKYHLFKVDEDEILVLYNEKNGSEIYEEFTEENYIKACDLCLKLFKGEK